MLLKNSLRALLPEWEIRRKRWKVILHALKATRRLRREWLARHKLHTLACLREKRSLLIHYKRKHERTKEDEFLKNLGVRLKGKEFYN